METMTVEITRTNLISNATKSNVDPTNSSVPMVKNVFQRNGSVILTRTAGNYLIFMIDNQNVSAKFHVPELASSLFDNTVKIFVEDYRRILPNLSFLPTQVWS